MKKVIISLALKTNYPVTRNEVDKLAKLYPAETVFDFRDINFASAAFADEFMRRFSFDKTTNTSELVRSIFTAVMNRKKQSTRS